jgi:hypothetical protein
LGSPSEKSQVLRLYEDISTSNFSAEVLSKCSFNLAVLRVNGVKWEDLGDPRRLTKLLEGRALCAPLGRTPSTTPNY